MPNYFEHRFFHIPTREIGYLRFILESYDGLCFMRTLDSRSGLIEISWPASRSFDLKGLLKALSEELPLQPASRPEFYQPL